MKYTAEDLTFKEMKVIRKLTGKGLSELANGDEEVFLAALYFTFKKREDATYKFEDAENKSVKDLSELVDLDPNHNGEK
ncbi:hypothetical protein [Streptomyces prunicolor]|uniref:hypothetical protein n=1 Tax=Streptomyces prunicolor TaxID=67348 RepID=UPI00036B450A|nr:hypothetical protein [Streptomyces prunicolor]